MTITEKFSPLSADWLGPDELKRAVAEDTLVVLPDRVSVVSGEIVAAFREDAQALRVRGHEQGLRVELLAPEGARLGVYSEHAAEWVLPIVIFLAGQGASIISNLIANVIQRHLDRWRESGQEQMPTLRYREAIFAPERIEVREIDGPPEDVLTWLRERPALPPASGDES